MTDGNEFSLPDGETGPNPEGQAAQAPAPVIVIEYRNRGIATRLMPPALILVTALAISSYQRKTPVWPLTPRPARPVEVAAAQPPPAPAVPDAPPPDAKKADVPAPEVAELSSRPRPPSAPNGAVTDVGQMSSPFDIVEGDLRPVEPPPAGTTAPEPAPVPVPTPNPAPALTAPDPTPAMTPDLLSTAPAAADDAPEPSRDEILNDIEREGQQKVAKRQDLEGLKTNARWLLLNEAITRVDSERGPFRDELKRVLAEEGAKAGEEIAKLCERYGKEPMPEVKAAYARLLRTASARTSRQAKVERMRAVGVPEPLILDQICHEFDKLINTRNGPRSEDEVRTRAARALLAIPVTPIGSKPTAGASDPAAPGGPARPLTNNASARPVAGFGSRP